MWQRSVLVCFGLSMLLFGCSDTTQDQGEHFYSGKRIQIVIPTSVGGGTDRFARLMAQGLSEFVPGNPTVVPRQMTGGGGILAGNWFAEQAPRDGTVLLASAGQGTLRQILGQQAVRIRPSDYEDLIALPMVRTVLLNPGKGVERREDVGLLLGGEPLHTALVDPISGITFVLQAGMMDLPLSIIPGYLGGRERDLAMFRGEIDIIQQVTSTYGSSIQPVLDRGGVLLWSDGLMSANGTIVRDPNFPDLPAFPEVYEMTFGEPPSGELWDIYKVVTPLVTNAAKVLQIHVDAPQEAKDALLTGIFAMVTDPDFYERMRRESEGHSPVYGEDLKELLREARDLSPAQQQFLRNYISERFELSFTP